MSNVKAVRMLREAKGDEQLKLPEHLVQEIKAGNCIAFVGAGFSAAARLPGWKDLLNGILERGIEEGKIAAKQKKEIEEMIAEGSASSLDRAAQIMEDKMGSAMLGEVVAEKLKTPEEVPQGMLERLSLLHSIPFAAILTTNFDGFLPGIPAAHPDAKVMMRKILRNAPLSLPMQIVRSILVDEYYKSELEMTISGVDLDDDNDPEWEEIQKFMESAQEMAKEKKAKAEVDEGGDLDLDEMDFEEDIGLTPIIQVHGSVASEEYARDPGLAFTREGYRNLLHKNPSYQKFMSSVMAGKTILYLGFSFSDEYINEMRSSIMTMLTADEQEDSDSDMDEEAKEAAKDKKQPPIAYAITMKKPQSEVNFYKRHEGVHLLNYVPKDPSSPGFEGMEKWLEALVVETNPLYRWIKHLAGKRVVICGKDELCGFVRAFNYLAKKKFGVDAANIHTVEPPPEGEDFDEDSIAEFMQSDEVGGTVDVLLVEYGGPEKLPFPARSFLEVLNSKPELRCPVLVTDRSPAKMHSEHKRNVMRMGAAGYINNFLTLFKEVQHVLKKPDQISEGGCCVQ